jgi:hypothetical protein
VLCALYFAREVFAVVFVHYELERNLHTARIAFVSLTVEVVAYRDEARSKLREHALKEIACFYGVAAKSAKITLWYNIPSRGSRIVLNRASKSRFATAIFVASIRV